MDATYLKRMYWKVTGFILIIVTLCLALTSYYSQKQFEQALIPEVAKKAQTVGKGINRLIVKAVDLGIAYDQLYAVNQAFAAVIAEHPEFDYIAATDRQGEVLFLSGELPAVNQQYFKQPAAFALQGFSVDVENPVITVGNQYVISVPIFSERVIAQPDGEYRPVEGQGIEADTGLKMLGMLHIGIGSVFIDQLLTEVMLDILVILIVALFFTRELLSFMSGAQLESTIDAYSSVLARVRERDFRGRINASADGELGRSMGKIDLALDELQEKYLLLKDRVRAIKTDDVWDNLTRRYQFLRPQVLDTHHSPVVTSSSQQEKAEVGGVMNRIRAPLFIFILAEELTRPFLPGYISQLLVPIPGLSPQVAIGLPIVLFMLIVAVGQPYLGVWSERFGRRGTMLLGALIASVGFLGTALALDFYQLLLWRSACALGYALVFVAAQGFILDHSSPSNRAKGFALFIGAIMVATICGPSIGGILADNIGYRQSFSVAAALALVAMIVIWRLPKDDRIRGASQQRRGSSALKLSVMTKLLLNRRFMSLAGLAAMPAKIGLTGICFYLLPLYILSTEGTQAMAGRLLMVYAVLMVIIVPLAAGVGNSCSGREKLVASGLCVSGIGGLALMVSDSSWAVLALICSLGVGQALSIASQSALVADHCDDEIQRFGSDAVYGVYRLLERLGNALGPLLASVLVIYQGYQGALVGIGLLLMLSGVLFALSIALSRERQEVSV
ncbi:MFS transporter [Motiliproteus sp. MSK22-1]|uniref:MFS transporter n=1 Tax=Motiliproteus sp. MSK22-1 TaxID=1897630 RepID=UPI0009780D02|nr:MFS transporter [Motiliproteus sp. MSK22-1]OMH30296.1 hypothetical protein BGP75_18065 [Motiliproteus sp. MSK22-1]